MGKYPKAKVVPFPSFVVTLHDPETKRVIGQLAILNVGGDTQEDWKQRQMLVAEDTAKRINCHDDLVAALDRCLALLDMPTVAEAATGYGLLIARSTSREVLAKAKGGVQ